MRRDSTNFSSSGQNSGGSWSSAAMNRLRKDSSDSCISDSASAASS
nr:MAG TPA: hypothetical protein [Caudoviricetes sp.]